MAAALGWGPGALCRKHAEDSGSSEKERLFRLPQCWSDRLCVCVVRACVVSQNCRAQSWRKRFSYLFLEFVLVVIVLFFLCFFERVFGVRVAEVGGVDSEARNRCLCNCRQSRLHVFRWIPGSLEKTVRLRREERKEVPDTQRPPDTLKEIFPRLVSEGPADGDRDRQFRKATV